MPDLAIKFKSKYLFQGEMENVDYRSTATQEVASYLWENYVEVNNPSDVVLLGIGSAALGVIHLLNTHGIVSSQMASRDIADFW